MTVRAGRTATDEAAPHGETGNMGAIVADLLRFDDDRQSAQLQLLYQRTADGQAMVSVRGELDIATVAHADAYLRAVLDGEKKGKVTLNLEDLTFCDAAGLGVLARVAGYARRTGRSLRLTSPARAWCASCASPAWTRCSPRCGRRCSPWCPVPGPPPPPTDVPRPWRIASSRPLPVRSSRRGKPDSVRWPMVTVSRWR